jgi:hypothetical protein
MFPEILKRVLAEYKEHVGKRSYYIIFLVIICMSIINAFEPLFFGAIIKELEEYYRDGHFDIHMITKIIVAWIAYMIIVNLIDYKVKYELVTRPCLVDYKKTIKKFCKHAQSMDHENLSRKANRKYLQTDR